MIPQALTSITTEELIGIIESITSIITKAGIEDSLLTDAITEVEEVKAELVKIIKRKKSNDITPTVRKYENFRDKGLKWLFNTVYGGTFSLDEEFEEHANKLYEVFTRHGLTMYRLPEKKQTAVMASLFEELATSAILPSVQYTAIGGIIDKVKEVNQKYLDSLDDRSHSEATRELLQLQSDASKKMRTKLENVINYVNLLNELRPDENIRILHNELSEVITQANSIVRAKISRKKGEAESETSTTDET